jgi:transcriptional regulator with XRE-family HTH domain
MDKSQFNRAFGTYLKSIRLQKNLTQVDLASLMAVNPQNISAIERGEVTPSIYWIYNLSKCLEMTFNEFLSGFSSDLNNPR